MINPLERIKADLGDPRLCRGSGRVGSRVSVDERTLISLIEDYERLDSYVRAISENSKHLQIEHQLKNSIEACYHQNNKSSDKTLIVIMQTLLPLIEKQSQIRIGRLL